MAIIYMLALWRSSHVEDRNISVLHLKEEIESIGSGYEQEKFQYEEEILTP